MRVLIKRQISQFVCSKFGVFFFFSDEIRSLEFDRNDILIISYRERRNEGRVIGRRRAEHGDWEAEACVGVS